MKLRTHDRYDYVPLRGRPDYTLARRPPAGRLFRAQPRAFLLRRGPGRRVGAAAGRSPTFSTTRGAITATGSAPGTCSMPSTRSACRWPPGQQRAVRLRAGAGGGLPRARRRDRRPRPDQCRAAGRPRRGRRARTDRRSHRPHRTEGEGRAPEGWLGPWISHSHRTPDLLAEAGYRYLLDWCMDDQPIWFTMPRRRPDHGGALSAGTERHSRHRRAQDGRPRFRRPDRRPVRRDAGAIPRSGRW